MYGQDNLKARDIEIPLIIVDMCCNTTKIYSFHHRTTELLMEALTPIDCKANSPSKTNKTEVQCKSISSREIIIFIIMNFSQC